MCEFCTKHGEEKKWYLQMKNYANELLHEELSSNQKDIVKTKTRVEWINGFFENFVMPAMGGVSRAQDELQDEPPSTKPPKPQPSEDEIKEMINDN